MLILFFAEINICTTMVYIFLQEIHFAARIQVCQTFCVLNLVLISISRAKNPECLHGMLNNHSNQFNRYYQNNYVHISFIRIYCAHYMIVTARNQLN